MRDTAQDIHSLRKSVKHIFIPPIQSLSWPFYFFLIENVKILCLLFCTGQRGCNFQLNTTKTFDPTLAAIDTRSTTSTT